MKTFFITFVYGANQELQRRPLWEDLIHITKEMDEAWCVLGDFNAVLYPGDRVGGTEVQLHEIKSFGDCITNCELQELRNNGPYYTWTNKTIWTRINRVDPSFLPLISSLTAQLAPNDPNTKLKRFLQTIEAALQKLNKDKYADLKTQLSRARADLEKV
ncbi:hypothetical protein Cgig2_033475 [Carnegiea gigantea]|uniref:Endonuclease/exonuclease/phosphatase domain-containing protein n=1 Tax=Carnegiea gigantea TaxID=171969 RepID=A0A9Q1JFP3_9CARY|nr:hypothetical protein Cgig2_033475 [Carnegiea gigantea]